MKTTVYFEVGSIEVDGEGVLTGDILVVGNHFIPVKNILYWVVEY